MIIFDTLDELESYKNAFDFINTIIEVMDHSTPYEEGPGEYENPGEGKGVHIVEAHLTSSSGFSSPKLEGKVVCEITLEGEEIVNIDGSVFRLSPGRFLIYSGDSDIKRAIMYSLPTAFKCVRFIF